MERLSEKPGFDYYRHGLRPGYSYHARPFFAPSYNQPKTGLPYGYSGARGYQPPDPTNWVFSPGRFLASVVMNRKTVNEEGDLLGMWVDLKIDVSANQISRIVIQDSVTDRIVSMPYQPIGFSPYGLVLDITRKEFKNLPE